MNKYPEPGSERRAMLKIRGAMLISFFCFFFLWLLFGYSIGESTVVGLLATILWVVRDIKEATVKQAR